MKRLPAGDPRVNPDDVRIGMTIGNMVLHVLGPGSVRLSPKPSDFLGDDEDCQPQDVVGEVAR